MQDEKQYEQLLMLYEQLLNGAHDIAQLIGKEDYDSAITMIQAREPIFLNCKCIRKYLELTPVQKKKIDKIYGELKTAEEKNIQTLEAARDSVKLELAKTKKLERLQNAYDNQKDEKSGSMINIHK